MSASSWLIVDLTVWLIVTIARQVFDLIGKLWIPVGFNLLQIICCITGLFGVCQRRICLLFVLSISAVISIFQNILISLWYIGIFGDFSNPVLSAGLPYSYSFFLRYTPYCRSHFDLAKSKWVQSPCGLPYHHIEAAQAILHIVLGLITLILSIVVLYDKRKAKVLPPSPARYAQITRVKRPHAPSSVNDISSGYMNSSYDDVNEAQEVSIDPYLPARSYERNSKKKRMKLKPNPMPQPNLEQYCSTETNDINDDAYSKPLPKNGKSCGRFKKYTEPSRRSVVLEPVSTNIPGERNNERRASSGNVTSLISFDPKSSTLLRVREHLDSEDDLEGYSRISKDKSVDAGSIYEKIRNKSCTIRDSNEILQHGREGSSLTEINRSQDSVPSMMAPVLSVTSSSLSASDRGCPVSTLDRPTPPLRLDLYRKEPHEQLYLSSKDIIFKSKNISPVSPGIKLSTEPLNSPGIKLLHDPEKACGKHRSAFHVQQRDNIIVVGHYHATNEFTLTKENGEPPNVPIISGNSLLV